MLNFLFLEDWTNIHVIFEKIFFEHFSNFSIQSIKMYFPKLFAASKFELQQPSKKVKNFWRLTHTLLVRLSNGNNIFSRENTFNVIAIGAWIPQNSELILAL